MKIGIDKIGFYVPSYYIELKELAIARNVDPDKYLIGLGQSKMAIIEKSQDCVTLAANAANQILKKEDIDKIDLVLFTTESGIDESKAAGLYVSSLLGLSKKCRFVELKQACYSSAIALSFAKNHIHFNPESKVLILASDIAKYGVNSAGEPTQGAGSVAMLISKNPRILELDDITTYISEDVSDFYRPVNCAVPIVDGKLSTETYIRFFDSVYSEYLEKTGLKEENFEAICLHMPYSKLGQKALQFKNINDKILKRYENSKYYNKKIGNIYTGSLFLSFISLLESDKTLKEGDKIGFFAYGSGATGEFFSGNLVEGYQNVLNTAFHESQVGNRIKLSIEEYETLYQDEKLTKEVLNHKYSLESVENYKRIYNKGE